MKLTLFPRCLLAVCFLGAAGLSAAEKLQMATGVTEPFLDVTLSAPVPGTVARHGFKEGSAVKEGDVIIWLDQRMEELEVARRKLIYESKVEVSAAAEQEKSYKSVLESTRKLYESTKSVSREELEKRELDHKQAVAEHEKLLVAEDREKIEYELAREQLRRRQIVSPLTGTVTRIHLQVGEDCKAQEPLARVVDTRRCYFVANMDAKAGYHLKVGQSVKLEVEAGAALVTVPGKITFVSPVVDTASGLLRVKAIFENADGKIRPGVAGRMYFEEARNAE
jgi:RND family efflux transporter MFP subunit